ncbi:hypothetical protein M1D68_07330 [Pseudomonas sp. R4-84]
MDIRSPALNLLFELYPVVIPGWISPVKPAGIANGGVPKKLYDSSSDGLLCVVDPWAELIGRSWTMAAFDRVDLYVNDGPTPVDGHTVLPGQEQERIPLHVTPGRLNEGVNKLHYKVTRVGNNEELSRPLNVLYHLQSPGEPSLSADLVIPLDVIIDGVSFDKAEQGVEFGFTYTNRRNYDHIDFFVGNVTVPFDVADVPQPVAHTLFTDTFRQAGDNPATPLRFTVTDQLGNANESKTRRLDIHLEVALITPTLDSVKDPAGQDIPDEGSTTSTALTLSGQASKGKQIEVYDGSGSSAVSKGTATADAATGLWTLAITVPAGRRRLYAKSLYHPTNVYSNVRHLTVAVALTIDTSPVRFTQPVHVTTASEAHPFRPDFSDVQRQASNGSPPYSYTSSNPSVASVNAADGRVFIARAGTTDIRVTDSTGASLAYTVTINQAWVWVFSTHRISGDNAERWRRSVSGAIAPSPGTQFTALDARYVFPADWRSAVYYGAVAGPDRYYRLTWYGTWDTTNQLPLYRGVGYIISTASSRTVGAYQYIALTWLNKEALPNSKTLARQLATSGQVFDGIGQLVDEATLQLRQPGAIGDDQGDSQIPIPDGHDQVEGATATLVTWREGSVYQWKVILQQTDAETVFGEDPAPEDETLTVASNPNAILATWLDASGTYQYQVILQDSVVDA